MTSSPHILQLHKVVHSLTFTCKHKYTLYCLLRSEKERICYSHMRKSAVKQIMRNPLQSYSSQKWSRSGCLFCQFFAKVLSHTWSPHTCLNILQYSSSLSFWQGKGDISLESHLQEFYSMLQKLKFTSQFSTILIIIKMAVKDRQGLCISSAGLTWTSGKQSYSWKKFVYKSLKGQKTKPKKILYHLSLPINLARLQSCSLLGIFYRQRSCWLGWH